MNVPGLIKLSSKPLASRADARLRIAVLVDRFGKRFGGAESYCVNVVAAMAMHHEITVIAHEFEHDLPIREIRVQKSDMWPSWYRVWRFAHKAQQLTREGYDIVHSHVNGPTGHVHTVHVTPFKYRHIAGKTLGRQALAMLSPRNLAYVHLEAARLKLVSGRHVVTVSPATRDQIEAAYTPEVDIEVVPPGVRPVARDATLRRQTRASLGWSDNETGYLLVARNPLRKGLRALLQFLGHVFLEAFDARNLGDRDEGDVLDRGEAFRDQQMRDDVVGSGHPTVHPDGRHVLTDAYVGEKVAYGDGTIPLRWIDLATGQEEALVRINAAQPCRDNPMRVDPHPAWDRTWRYVVFNGFVGGTRRLFLADLQARVLSS